MKIEKVEMFRTEDGKIHATEEEAKQHGTRGIWMKYCDRQRIPEDIAETLWETRSVVVGLLGKDSAP